MPRKKSAVEPYKVTVTSTPKLGLYLEDLKDEEGYGNSVAEVARTLVWRGIEELIKGGILDRRKGSVGRAAGQAAEGQGRS
jgi:hypothetical protein